MFLEYAVLVVSYAIVSWPVSLGVVSFTHGSSLWALMTLLFKPHSETFLLYSNANKRAMLLMKVGVVLERAVLATMYITDITTLIGWLFAEGIWNFVYGFCWRILFLFNQMNDFVFCPSTENPATLVGFLLSSWLTIWVFWGLKRWRVTKIRDFVLFTYILFLLQQ